MITERKRKIIEEVRTWKKNKPLIFIHTPKCGGTYAAQILKDLNIKNNGHNLANVNEGINFTIIRDPADRFESLLNYRLATTRWPSRLMEARVHNSSLNAIIEQMSDFEIVSFVPYRSLTYWSRNVDVFITIDELKEFLEIFGYTYDEKKYSPVNVSIKNRGRLNDLNRQRIYKLYQNDVALFKKWTC